MRGNASITSTVTLTRRLLILALLAALPGAGHAQQTLVGTASVIDGDTIEVHGVRIRMHGIDAPESRQECVRADGTSWRCGQQAALALSDRIGRATVRCEPRDRDRYGRVVAVCFKGAEDLDRWMVANGWAVAYRKYSLDYVADEERAQRDKLGVWSGSFEMPWDWRARGTRH
jgi:endonuclease YncB( thermonuclease family)